MSAARATDRLASAANPIDGLAADYDGIVELARDRIVVLIGEGSHGTDQFYRERARLTQRLIVECGFNAVAVEGDWPDADRVNRYVMGRSPDGDAVAALGDFCRFPTIRTSEPGH